MNETIANTAENFLGYTKDSLHIECSEWCAEFVSLVLFSNGLEKFTSTSCNTMFNLMKNSNCWILPDNNPTRGDVIFFDWNGDKDPEKDTRPLDHVGIVTACDGKTLTYIDGNSDTSGIVKKHSIVMEWSKFNSKYPWYYMRYVKPETTTKPVTDNTLETLRTLVKDLEKILEEIKNINI